MANTLDFSGKVALVTGAAAGMGLATARAFAEAGAAAAPRMNTPKYHPNGARRQRTAAIVPSAMQAPTPGCRAGPRDLPGRP